MFSDSSRAKGSVCFGPYELLIDSEELRKDGARLKLSGQAIQVLVVLVNNCGKLVTREELQQKLWPGATNGDFEHGLNAAVNRLRENLGDSATDPNYIETVPRRGYRFIARVNQAPNIDSNGTHNVVELHCQHATDLGSELAKSANERATDSSSQSATSTRAGTSRRTLILIAAIALCVATGFMAWSARRNAKVRWATHVALPEIVRLADADRFDDAYRLAHQVKPLILDDPLLAEEMRGSRGAPSSSPIPPAVKSSTAHTAEAESRGGRSAKPLSNPTCHAASCTGRSKWRVGRWRRTLVLVLSGRSFAAGSRSSIPNTYHPAWHASHHPMHRSTYLCLALNISPKSTCRITGLIGTRLRIATSNGSSMKAVIVALSSGKSHS